MPSGAENSSNEDGQKLPLVIQTKCELPIVGAFSNES